MSKAYSHSECFHPHEYKMIDGTCSKCLEKAAPHSTPQNLTPDNKKLEERIGLILEPIQTEYNGGEPMMPGTLQIVADQILNLITSQRIEAAESSYKTGYAAGNAVKNYRQKKGYGKDLEELDIRLELVELQLGKLLAESREKRYKDAGLKLEHADLKAKEER